MRPFISGLLVSSEIAGAFELFGAPAKVCLIAGDPQLAPYRAALADRGCEVAVIDPEAAFIAGLHRIALAAKLTG